eukprot:gene5985-5278_t
MEESLAIRREYLSVYRAYCMLKHPKNFVKNGFKMPKGWTEKSLKERMSNIETRLTLSQAVVHQTFVAIHHSKLFLDDPAMMQRAKALMNMLSMFVDALPTSYEEAADARSTANPVRLDLDGQEILDSRPSQSMTSYTSLYIKCPRVGITLAFQGDAAKGVQPGASSQPPGSKSPLDAAPNQHVSVVANGISVDLQDFRLLVLQAHHIQVSAGKVDDPNPKHMLCIPTPERIRCNEATPKFNFCEAYMGVVGKGGKVERKLGAPKLLPFVNRCNSILRGTLLPEAPISDFLPHIKIALLPLDLSIGAKSTQICLGFVKAFSEASKADCWTSKMITKFPDPPATSLSQLIEDSYHRHRIPVPASVSSLGARLELTCSSLTVRTVVHDSAWVSIGGITSKDYKNSFIVNLTNISLETIYCTSSFGTLSRSISVHTDLESTFQFKPKEDVDRRASYTKLWLLPPDVNVLYGEKLSGAGQFVKTARNEPLRFDKTSKNPLEKTEPRVQPLTTNPYVPIILVKRFSTSVASQIPYEPSVPGCSANHVTVSAFGVQAWYSFWQVDLLMSLIDSVISHPLLTMGSDDKPLPKKDADASTTAAADATKPAAERASDAKTSPDVQRPAQAQDKAVPAEKHAEGPKRPSSDGTSALSVFMEFPMISLLAYANLKESSTPHHKQHHQVKVHRSVPLAQHHQVEVHRSVPLAWATKLAGKRTKEQIMADPLLNWAHRISPALMMCFLDTRVGFVHNDDALAAQRGKFLDPRVGFVHNDGALVAQRGKFLEPAPALGKEGSEQRRMLVLVTMGSAICSHQFGLLNPHIKNGRTAAAAEGGYIQMWQNNSSGIDGQPYCPGGHPTPGPSDFHLAEKFQFLFAPLQSRAMASLYFWRDRRRAMMGVDSRLLNPGPETRGVVHQRWRRVFDMHLLARTSDYATFLLFSLGKLQASRNYKGDALHYYKLLQTITSEAEEPIPNSNAPTTPDRSSSSMPAMGALLRRRSSRLQHTNSSGSPYSRERAFSSPAASPTLAPSPEPSHSFSRTKSEAGGSSVGGCSLSLTPCLNTQASTIADMVTDLMDARSFLMDLPRISPEQQPTSHSPSVGGLTPGGVTRRGTLRPSVSAIDEVPEHMERDYSAQDLPAQATAATVGHDSPVSPKSVASYVNRVVSAFEEAARERLPASTSTSKAPSYHSSPPTSEEGHHAAEGQHATVREEEHLPQLSFVEAYSRIQRTASNGKLQYFTRIPFPSKHVRVYLCHRLDSDEALTPRGLPASSRSPPPTTRIKVGLGYSRFTGGMYGTLNTLDLAAESVEYISFLANKLKESMPPSPPPAPAPPMPKGALPRPVKTIDLETLASCFYAKNPKRSRKRG